MTPAELVFREHGCDGVRGPDPVPGGVGAAEAALTATPRRAGRRSVDRVRDRIHAPLVHVLPTDDLGLPVAPVAAPEGDVQR
jgi:hypothetical protein